MKIRFSLICRSDKRHMYNLAKSSTSITEIEAHLEKTNSRDCVPGGTIDEPRLKDSREDAQVKGCYLKQRETSMLGRIYCRRPVNNRREWISKAVAFAVRSDLASAFILMSATRWSYRVEYRSSCCFVMTVIMLGLKFGEFGGFEEFGKYW